MAGAGTGIGIGIGNAMGDIGDAIRERRKRQADEREKRADALHTKGMQIAGKLLESGYTTKQQDGQHILVDRRSGNPVQNPPQDISQMYNELLSTSKEATGLFPPHEANALAQHFRKFLGKQQQPATPDPRAAQQSPESFASEVPAQKFTGEADQFRQLSMLATDPSQPKEVQEGARNRLKQLTQETGDFEQTGEPKLDKTTGRYYQTYASKSDPSKQKTVKMPMDFQPKGTLKEEEKPKKALTPKAEGDDFIVTDPNNGATYGSWNINNPDTPPEAKSMYNTLVADKKAKADAAEAKELAKVKAAEERQNKLFEHQDAAAAQRYKEAYDRQDHAEANAIRKGAETRYNSALSLSAFADEAAAHVSAAKDKLLAGRLIRESEGRFNPAQYDNLVKNAGLANTFSQWLESAESGQLTDPVRAQLVDAAHALLSSAKTAVDAVTTPTDLKNKANPNSDKEQLLKELQGIK